MGANSPRNCKRPGCHSVQARSGGKPSCHYRPARAEGATEAARIPWGLCQRKRKRKKRRSLGLECAALRSPSSATYQLDHVGIERWRGTSGAGCAMYSLGLRRQRRTNRIVNTTTKFQRRSNTGQKKSLPEIFRRYYNGLTFSHR